MGVRRGLNPPLSLLPVPPLKGDFWPTFSFSEPVFIFSCTARPCGEWSNLVLTENSGLTNIRPKEVKLGHKFSLVPLRNPLEIEVSRLCLPFPRLLTLICDLLPGVCGRLRRRASAHRPLAPSPSLGSECVALAQRQLQGAPRCLPAAQGGLRRRNWQAQPPPPPPTAPPVSRCVLEAERWQTSSHRKHLIRAGRLTTFLFLPIFVFG